MIAGALEIQMLADVARLRSDVQQGVGIVSAGVQQIERLAAIAKTALGAIGVGVGVGAVTALVKETIEATARFKDLAQEAGTTASAISRFEAPARMAGSSVGSVAAAIYKMSQAAIEARDPASKAAQALNVIGISTKQLKDLKPDEMFELAARQLGKYGEGIDKNAVMQVLFSKSGREMSRVVAEIAEKGQLAATVTDEQAEAADRFGDQLVELKMTSEAAWRSLVSEGLPAMNAILKAFIDGKREAGLFQGAVQAVAEFFSQAFGSGSGSAAERLAAVNKQIAIAQDAAARLADLPPDLLTLADGDDLINAAKLNELLRQRLQLEREVASDGIVAQNRAATGVKGSLRFNPADEAARAAGLKAYAAENVELDKQIAKLRGVGELEAYIAKLQEDKFKNITPAQRDELISKEKLLLQLQHEQQLREKILASVIPLIEANHRAAQAEQDYAIAARDSVDQLRFEASLVGMTPDSIAKANAMRRIELDLKRQIAAIDVEDGDFQTADQIARIERMRTISELQKQHVGQIMDGAAAARDQAAVWTQLGDAAGNFLSDLVMHGRSAFDNLRKWVKQLLSDMIGLFAKRWILNLAANGDASSPAGIAANQAGNQLGGSLLGLGANAAASYLGFTGGIGTAAQFGGALTGAIPSAAIGSSAVAAGVGVDTAAASAGAGLAPVYEALASIPVWGWVAMAVIAAVAYFSGRGGGPKVGGSYFSGGAVPGTDNGRFFTPDQGDAQVRDIVNTTLDTYATVATRLGGTAGSFNFGLGFDHDPNGSARSRVSSGLYGADGNLIYGSRDHEMDNTEVPAALSLEAKRAFMAMLQHTDFDDALDALFAGIDVSTATSEQLDAVLLQAQEMKGIIDALATWSIKGIDIGAIQRMRFEGESLTQTFNAVTAAQSQYEQLFYTEEERNTLSLDRMTRAFKDMGIELPTTRAGFRALVDSIDTTTEAGAHLYRWLITIAPAFADLHPVIDDTTTAVDDVTDSFSNAATVLGQTASGVREWEDIFHGYYAGRGNREAIAQYLNDQLIGPQSPLDYKQRLAMAKDQFETTLTAANGGDLAAGGRLQGAADAYLQLLRQVNASGGNTSEEFVRVFNALAHFAEVPDFNTRMLSNADRQTQYVASIAEQTRRTSELLEQLVSQQSAETDRIVSTVNSAAVETSRR
jgi:uncharacterized phage infection (PIP) family protein YhgE